MLTRQTIQLRTRILLCLIIAIVLAFAVPCHAVFPESNHVRIVPTLDKTILAECHANTSWGTDFRHLGLGSSLPRASYDAGEPVKLLVTVTNRSDHWCQIERGYMGELMVSLDIVVVGPDGTLSGLRNPDRKDITYSRGRIIGESLDGKGYQDLEIDLSQMFDLSAPGQYLAYAKRRIYGEVLTSGNALFVVASKNTPPSEAAATASPESPSTNPRFKGAAATPSDGGAKPYGLTKTENDNTRAHQKSTSASHPFGQAKPLVRGNPDSGRAPEATIVATAIAL